MCTVKTKFNKIFSLVYKLIRNKLLRDCLYRPFCKPLVERTKTSIRRILSKLWKRRIIAKLKKKRPIHIVFQVHDSAKWACQSLYDAFDKDPMFTVQIVVTLINDVQDFYHSTLRFFQEKGMNVAGAVDEQNGKNTPFADFVPDIVFFQEPLNLWLKPGTALFCYVPYGFCLSHLHRWNYNGKIHLFLWKHFVETDYHLKFAKQYGAVKGDNVIVSGYPKMDGFLQNDSQTVQCPLWKTNSPDIKRIIYAPHWTVVENVAGLLLGNFLQYYQLLFDYVRQHHEIEVVLKPHPWLKYLIIKKGLMTEEALNTFFEQWNELPNGSVVEGGDYFDLFKTSDAMILDSSSFTCEYTYTAKPLLFLYRTPDILKNEFNEFGQEISKNHYQAHSFEDIERFIQDTVLGGDDPLLSRRKQFVEDVLLRNKKPAAEFIVEHIKKAICS